jgi:hypothetical protein
MNLTPAQLVSILTGDWSSVGAADLAEVLAALDAAGHAVCDFDGLGERVDAGPTFWCLASKILPDRVKLFRVHPAAVALALDEAIFEAEGILVGAANGGQAEGRVYPLGLSSPADYDGGEVFVDGADEE